MIRRPPRSTRTETLFPYTTLFRSAIAETMGRLETDLRAAGLGYAYPVLYDADCDRVWDLRRAGQGLMNNVSGDAKPRRSEEHTSELQSLMRNSYAVFCLKKKKKLTHSTESRKKKEQNITKLQ